MNIAQYIAQTDENKKDEILAVLKEAATKQEAIEKLQTAGLEVTEADLDEFASTLTEGTEPVTDEGLAAINGGAFYESGGFSTLEKLNFVAKAGDIVEVASGWGFGSTVRCVVVETRINESHFGITNSAGYVVEDICTYYDEYKVQELESHWYFHNGWKDRDDIEMPR